MPTPKPGEGQDEFVSRCMSHPDLADKSQDQRAAICFDLFARNTDKAYNVGNVKDNHMTEQIRVNITQRVNGDMIRKEKRNGRDVIVVRSATLPDNVVMNGIRYPASEIEASFKTLENTPAPLGHPMVGNSYVSAKSPEGLNVGYFGAWNANVRRENGRVMIDKVIDVERASESKMGKRVLDAINEGKPIHTSTGLLTNLRPIEDDEAEFEAFNMDFDHDAILLDEPGAATPEQGVGMMVNGAKVRVINSMMDNMDEHIDMLGQELMRAVERREDASAWMRVKSAVFEALGLGRETETKSDEVSEMTEVTKDEFEKLSARVNEVAEGQIKLDDVKGVINDALAPVIEAQNAAKEAADAKAKEAHNAAVERVVNKGILSEEDAKATPLAVLEKLVNAKGDAANLSGGYQANGDDSFGFADDWEDK